MNENLLALAQSLKAEEEMRKALELLSAENERKLQNVSGLSLWKNSSGFFWRTKDDLRSGFFQFASEAVFALTKPGMVVVSDSLKLRKP